MTTFLASSMICSPKGSAVWTGATGGGAGVWDADGVSAGDLVSAGGGTGLAEGAGADVAGLLAAGGAGEGDGLGAGACASAALASAAAGSSAITAIRKERLRIIRMVPMGGQRLRSRAGSGLGKMQTS